MVTSIALLTIKKGQTAAFEDAFAEAQPIIEAARGYIQHELQQCLEREEKYLLTVRWNTLEDHTAGFMGSAGHREWMKRLQPFFTPGMVTEHYKRIF
jgi:heme-degrading monooxygenase HmoA